MAQQVELAVFLMYAVVPFLALLFSKWLKSWGLAGMVIAGSVGILGFVMLAAMAQYMFADYDVVLTKVYGAYNSTDYERDANGNLTGTVETETPERTETIPIINDDQYIFGMVLWGLAFALGIIWFKVMTTG